MTECERKIFDVIYACGGITKMWITKLGGTPELIQELMEKKFLKKQPVVVKDKKIALFVVSPVGKKYYTEETGKQTFFVCNRPEKIVLLLYFYMKLPDAVKATWKTKDEWYLDGLVGTIPDATFVMDEKLYGTVALPKNEIEKKKPFLLKFKAAKKLESIKVQTY